ncbi:PREDICTED: thaumatin-like protein [Tarenaya hassleriana]|uniref:thaumatin-like protein n=1 Tax=Tarenaya hassleriana TaxID=28532 RepID=UPI00053C706E|nr:PREDICTED: thaumatin-like protein [Tarenaya hassleriana]
MHKTIIKRVQVEMSTRFGLFPKSLLLVIILYGAKSSEGARVFTIVNACKYKIWPAIMPGEHFNGGGFELKSGQSIVFRAPVAWSGRIWARTGCNFDAKGKGKCLTGACGSSLRCTASGEPPATLTEFTLATPDFYDVSLVDGFNLPVLVTPVNGQGNCSAAGCDGDVNGECPPELAVKSGKGGKAVACKSACEVFDRDEYCCRGVYGNPVVCQPTYYSKIFKKACPTAYSYAYDDPTSIFTCTGTDYIITFCSSRNQSVCTFHDNKLSCGHTSDGFKLVNGGWWLVTMLILLFIVDLWINPAHFKL